MAGDVKFVRMNGRVVPIKRKDGGADMRSSGSRSTSGQRKSAFKEAASKTHMSSSTRAKRAAFFGVAAGIGGAVVGGALGAAVGSVFGRADKGAAIGAATLGGGAGIAFATHKEKVASNRQYNKALGKRVGKRK